jgi:RNA polymerase sigma-70 factor (ECF subfamily)
MPPDAISILAQQAASDPQAFLSLYDLFFKRVYNYICLRCADPDLADDLTARIFERLLQKISQYNPERGSFEPWLFTIARNEVRAHFRRQRFAWLPLDFLTKEPYAGLLPEEQTIQSETNAELLQALDQLEERERDLLGLKFSAGLDSQDIARLTGLSANNVRVILHRSLARIRTLLQKDNHLLEKSAIREINNE